MKYILTSRENLILRAIVQEYSSSAHPVGSRLLWTRYGLGISPATIRGVMSALTEAGYLSQPHTSAGRVPTEQAYRLFVDSAEASTPSVGEQEKLAARLERAESTEEAGQVLGQQLSEAAGSAGFYLDRRGAQLYNLANVFGQPEFEDPRVAGYVAQLIDQLAEWVPKLTGQTKDVAVRIGQENDDFRARQVSVLAMPIGDGYVGVIGSTRMPYRKLMSLFTFVKERLEQHHDG